MNRKLFTEEQQLLLYQKPYIYTITETRSNLTKEFQMIFMTAYKASKSPEKSLKIKVLTSASLGNATYGGFPNISVQNTRNMVNSMRDMVRKVLQPFFRVPLIPTPRSPKLTKSDSSNMK